MRHSVPLTAMAGIPFLAIGLAAAYRPSPAIGRALSAHDAARLRGGCETLSQTTCAASTGSFNGYSCAGQTNYWFTDPSGTAGMQRGGTIYCGLSNGNCSAFSGGTGNCSG
jgi:hypothetical protein